MDCRGRIRAAALPSERSLFFLNTFATHQLSIFHLSATARRGGGGEEGEKEGRRRGGEEARRDSYENKTSAIVILIRERDERGRSANWHGKVATQVVTEYNK